MEEKETDCQPLCHLCVWETLYCVHVGKEFYSGRRCTVCMWGKNFIVGNWGWGQIDRVAACVENSSREQKRGLLRGMVGYQELFSHLHLFGLFSATKWH